MQDTRKMRGTLLFTFVPILSSCFAGVDAFRQSFFVRPHRRISPWTSVPPVDDGSLIAVRARRRKNQRVQLTPPQLSESSTDDSDAEHEASTLARHRLSMTTTRRRAIENLLVAIPAAATAIGWTGLTADAHAIDDASSLDDIARRFGRRVPTFALVDGPTGTPFMILNNAGVATGYFFTSYEGAKIVLEDAKKDAAQRDLATADTWNNARITAVPLEFALKLAKARPKSRAQNGNRYDTVYDVIATAEDLKDAQFLDKSGIFAERGRVPLFYIDGLEIPSDSDGGGGSRLPVFLRKSDALRAWEKKFPGEASPPKLKVMELVRTFDDMLRSRGDDGLVVVPPVDSRRAAMECEKNRGSNPVYQKNEMVAVGGK